MSLVVVFFFQFRAKQFNKIRVNVTINCEIKYLKRLVHIAKHTLCVCLQAQQQGTHKNSDPLFASVGKAKKEERKKARCQAYAMAEYWQQQQQQQLVTNGADAAPAAEASATANGHNNNNNYVNFNQFITQHNLASSSLGYSIGGGGGAFGLTPSGSASSNFNGGGGGDNVSACYNFTVIFM